MARYDDDGDGLDIIAELPPVDGEDRLGEPPLAVACLLFRAGPACTSGVVELSSSG